MVERYKSGPGLKPCNFKERGLYNPDKYRYNIASVKGGEEGDNKKEPNIFRTFLVDVM